MLERVYLVVASKLQSRIDVSGEPAGKAPAIIEVYPAASVASALGSIETYKQKPSSRRRLLDRLVARFGLALPKGDVDAVVGEGKGSDNLDALIAAVTAGVYWHAAGGHSIGCGLTIRSPRGDEIESALREGWIFFPVARSP